MPSVISYKWNSAENREDMSVGVTALNKTAGKKTKKEVFYDSKRLIGKAPQDVDIE